jgi:lipopolysaccharide transport protein LptA
LEVKRVLALLPLLLWSGFAVEKVNLEKDGLSLSRIDVSCDDGMTVQTRERWAEFSKNVDVKLDDIQLKCAHLRLTYSEDEDDAQVESMTATGGVYLKDGLRNIVANSDRLNYNRAEGWLIFSSDKLTTVVQDGNKMEAPSIRVNIESGTVLVDGKGRVEIRLKDL